MSNRQPSVQVLKAPTINEGLLEREQEKDVIEALNERFPQGLQKPTIMMMLPRCWDQAQALFSTWDAGSIDFAGLCVEKNQLPADMPHSSGESYPFQAYMFSRAIGWHAVSPGRVLRQVA